MTGSELANPGNMDSHPFMKLVYLYAYLGQVLLMSYIPFFPYENNLFVYACGSINLTLFILQLFHE
jgi:hypothetical protein